MKYTIITALTMLTACCADPHALRQSDSNSVIISIIDNDVAMRQINTPICHFKGC